MYRIYYIRLDGLSAAATARVQTHRVDDGERRKIDMNFSRSINYYYYFKLERTLYYVFDAMLVQKRRGNTVKKNQSIFAIDVDVETTKRRHFSHIKLVLSLTPGKIYTKSSITVNLCFYDTIVYFNFESQDKRSRS